MHLDGFNPDAGQQYLDQPALQLPGGRLVQPFGLQTHGDLRDFFQSLLAIIHGTPRLCFGLEELLDIPEALRGQLVGLVGVRYFAQETNLSLSIGLLIDTSGSTRRVLPDERSASYVVGRQSSTAKRAGIASGMHNDRNMAWSSPISVKYCGRSTPGIPEAQREI